MVKITYEKIIRSFEKDHNISSNFYIKNFHEDENEFAIKFSNKDKKIKQTQTLLEVNLFY